MKSLKYTLVIASAFMLGCSDYLNVNDNPNSPSDANERLILPAAQQSLAACVGNRYRLVGSMWSQFYTQSNVANQYIQEDNYDVNQTDFLEPNFTELYSGGFNDIQLVKNRSKASQNWTNFLIATVVEAYGYQMIADLYDGAPLTDALQGSAGNFNPTWDSGQEVYDTLIARLDYALSKDFQVSTNVNPGNSDLLFGGDVDQWIRFANTLKLKMFMRYSHVDPNRADTEITALINSGAQFLDADASISRYYNETGRGNPLFEADRRSLNTGNNLRASFTMVNYLQLHNDPRVNAFYNAPQAGGPVTGQIQGTSSQTNQELDDQTISIVRLSPFDDVQFISLAESYFLRAEAAVRGFSNEDAEQLYNQGVLAAFARYNIDGSAFVSPGGAYEYPSGTTQENLEAIMTQKWIAHVGGNGMEAWWDILRTNIPAMSPHAADDAAYAPLAAGAQILTYPVDAVTFNMSVPRRLLIPNDEVTNNANAPEQPANGVLTPVWWDVN